MDASIRKRYISLVRFLGESLGPSYEIVLQEIDEDMGGIIAIANGEISGRKVGNHLTGVALKFIMEKRYEHADSVLNYVGILDNGKIVRSSTYFIKEQNKLLGMLCINYDSSGLQEFSDMLLKQFHPDSFLEQNHLLSNKGFVNPELYSSSLDQVEYFKKDTEALMNEIFEKALKNLGYTTENLSPSDRQILVAQLYSYGMFQIKDSIEFAAKHMNCSTVSVYRYLKKAKEA